jgi:hypothetical protein
VGERPTDRFRANQGDQLVLGQHTDVIADVGQTAGPTGRPPAKPQLSATAPRSRLLPYAS